MTNAGRPTDYKPEFNEQAEKLCKLGATDKDLAEFFEVCEATINNWKIDHPEFLESIKTGKQIADMEVANSLYKRATGYNHASTKFFQYDGKVISQDFTEHYPPDVTAQIFWLKNRKPKEWRDKQEIDLTGSQPVIISLKLDADSPDTSADTPAAPV